VNIQSVFQIMFVLILLARPAMAASAFTYSGKILDSNNTPLNSSNVLFTVTIYDALGQCWLYTEQRQLDFSQSSGTFSFDIGSNDSTLVASSASLNGGATGPQNLSDVFNNVKSFSGLGTANSCSGTYTPNPSDLTAGRQLAIYFKVDGGANQALPVLKINPVPAALTVGGYGSGELLKIDGSINLATNANTPLSQTQYDEFWRLIKNPLSAYLPTTGDVTVSGGNNKVTTLLTKALPVAAPTTAGQVLSFDGTNWVYQTLGTGSVTSVTATAPVVAGGTATAPVISMPAATASADGYLDKDDFAIFNAKLSSAGGTMTGDIDMNGHAISNVYLASAAILVGNASNRMAAVAMGGDVTIASNGATTIGADKITTGKILDATILGADMDFTGAVNVNSGLVIKDNTGKFNNFLCSTVGHVPTWTATGWVCQATPLPNLASALMWVGNGSGVATAVSLSGDATISNSGAVTVDKTATGAVSKILALDGSGIANAYGVGVKGATSGTATIQAPAAFTSYTLTMPTSVGAANQTLMSDGSGGLSWMTPYTVTVPASSVLVMKTCPAAWTDNGATGGGPGTATCDGTNCRMCQSPTSEELIPASSTLLMESCPSSWTNSGAAIGPGAAGYQNVNFVACQSPATAASLPLNSRIIMSVCPSQWYDVGATGPSSALATCGGAACRVCEVPGLTMPSHIQSASGGTTLGGQGITLQAGDGGTTSGSGGPITIRSGASTDGDGGSITMTASNGATTTATTRFGGTFTITAGDGASNGGGGNVVIKSGAGNGTGNVGNILLNSTGSGNVAIGSATANAKLDVNGAVKIGTSADACSATNAGAQRYNSTENIMEYCNSALWVDFNPPGTQCGVQSSSITKNCRSADITTTCPDGYTRTLITLTDTLDGTHVNGYYTCVKD